MKEEKIFQRKSISPLSTFSFFSSNKKASFSHATARVSRLFLSFFLSSQASQFKGCFLFAITRRKIRKRKRKEEKKGKKKEERKEEREGERRKNEREKEERKEEKAKRGERGKKRRKRKERRKRK